MKTEGYGSSNALAAARQGYSRLTELGQQQRQVEDTDDAWLRGLGDELGRDSITVTNPDDPRSTVTFDTRLDASHIKGQPEAPETLRTTLRAMLEATESKPLELRLGNEQVRVHNPDIAAHMKATYTPAEFDQLFDAADQLGVYHFEAAGNGLVHTTGEGAAESADMSQRQWITDTVRDGDLERDKDPVGWQHALHTLSAFYSQPSEVEALEKGIRDPRSYREGGPMEGPAHIFFPVTLQRDPSWFNNKRLESHGHALEAFCQALTAGAQGEPWGIRPQAAPPEMLSAINRLATFFKAIDYPTAPSAGNWEETPFKGGLTSDTAAISDAFDSLRDLLYNPAYDQAPGMSAVRQQLFNGPHGAWMRDASQLGQQVNIGEARVRRTSLQESPGHRPMDASLVFVGTSRVKLADTPTEDVRRHLEVMDTVERNLVREDGMIRYAPFKLEGSNAELPDSYLSLNYHIAADPDGKLNLQWKTIMDKFGSKDASDPAVFEARAKYATSGKEAQWFMVSDLSRGYAKQLRKLIDHVKTSGRQPNADEWQLMQRCLAGATRNINRAYARITPPGGAKANGYDCPVGVPEAYQFVSTLRSDAADPSKREVATLPGTHTPLAWAASSLYGASKEYQAALQSVADLGMLDSLNHWSRLAA
jgi:hypothetical protein